MTKINLEDHVLVYVVRKDGESGLYLGVDVSKAHAIVLLELVANRLRKELNLNES